MNLAQNAPTRRPFNPANHSLLFLEIMNECHTIMINHQGRFDTITQRDYTVEMVYYFPTTHSVRATEQLESKVVLYLSYNKNGKFTASYLGGAGDKPFQFKSLKEEIDLIPVRHQGRSCIYAKGVNMVDEVRRELEEMNCMGVEMREIRHGIKFTGYYRDQAFRFNVYTTQKGLINIEMKKRRDGRVEETKNPVWELPREVPNELIELKTGIERVIAWVKGVQRGRSNQAALRTRSTNVQLSGSVGSLQV